MTEREQDVAALRAVFQDHAEACCLLGSLRDASGRVFDFEVVDLNRAGEQALRQRREAVVGQRLAAVFMDPTATETARRVVVSGEPIEEDIDGATRRMTPAGDGVAVTLRRSGDADPHAAEAFERKIGGLVHDFNNLLTPILAYTNIGLAQIGPGQPLYEELLEIQRAAERATALVQQVQMQQAPAPKCPPGDG